MLIVALLIGVMGMSIVDSLSGSSIYLLTFYSFGFIALILISAALLILKDLNILCQKLIAINDELREINDKTRIK